MSQCEILHCVQDDNIAEFLLYYLINLISNKTKYEKAIYNTHY